MGEIHVGFITKTIGNLVGSITGSNDQADAIQSAAKTQAASAQAGINQQQQMLAALQKVLSPYVTAGTGALGAQQNLLGLNGNDAQQAAINGIQSSPQFAALQKQGQDAILANASATGGLRGGNVQGALGQFSPALLSQLIQQQLGNLGGLTSMGESAAAGVGNAGLQTGNNVANLLQQQGAATAGGQIGAGNRTANGFNSMLGIGGLLAASGALNGLGGLFGGSSAGSLFPTNGAAGGLITPGALPNVSIPMLSKF
jgi:hypothetical protein